MFRFDFASLDFSSPEKNQYSYMLEGFDKEWVNTSSSQRFATYMNLKSGNYKFKVNASNSDGYWNRSLSVSVIIVPPFWMVRFWFFGIVILLIISGLIVVVRLRNIQIKANLSILEDKVREEPRRLKRIKLK